MHKGTRERNKKKRGTVPSGQWINSRKKKCATNIDLLPIPDEFEPLPSDKTKQNSLESYFHKEVDEVCLAIVWQYGCDQFIIIVQSPGYYNQ